MRSGTCAAYLAAAAGLLCGGVAAAQTIHPEVEPNDSKAAANVVAGLVHGDRITGLTRGGLANGLDTSLDCFLVSAAVLPPGVYRHQLNVVSTPLTGLTLGLRGLDQTAAGAIVATSDVQVASGIVSAGVTLSSVWYGFGRQERVYIRMTGTAASQPYILEFTTTPAAVTPIAGTFAAGTMTFLVEAVFGNPDAEVWLYDANMNPVSGGNNDDPVTPMSSLDRASMTRNLAAGTYYMAVGVANMSNHLASPMDEATPADDDVLDFAGALVPAGGLPVNRTGNITIMDAAGLVTLPAVPMTTTARWYQFQVGGGCVSPSIEGEPMSLAVTAGQPAVLDVVATGTEPLAYQWEFNGVTIPGATGPTHTIASALLTHAGAYSVVVTNGCGQVESASAQLAVSPLGPSIVIQPQSQGLCLGEEVYLTVEASANLGAPLGFQWRKDGVAIPFAWNSYHQFSLLSAGDEGLYDCVVTEVGVGSTTSDVAAVSVRTDPPVITLNGAANMQIPVLGSYTEPGASATDDCDPSVAVLIGGDTVNTQVPGMYVVTYDAMDSQGYAAATVQRYVHVVDTVKPKVFLSIRWPILWPLNHTLAKVGLSTAAKDPSQPSGPPLMVKVRVFSDEPELPADKDDPTARHAPDAKNIAHNTLRLRRERQPKGNGRVYLVMASARDESGNIGFAFGTVVAPRWCGLWSLKQVLAEAKAIRTAAAAAANTATTEQAVVDALKAKGYSEHGLAKPRGPYQ